MTSLSFLLVALTLSSSDVSAKNVLMLVADDVGRELKVYGNTAIKMPNLDKLAERSAAFTSAFTAVSSCSPSRSAILTGLPPHQNGMFGLHHLFHHFSSFDQVLSLPGILSNHGVRTGIIGKKHVGPESVYPFEFDHSETNDNLLQASRNITYIRELSREFLRSNDSRPFFLYIGFMDAHRCDGKLGTFCEKFGNGDPGMGSIPDWTPTIYGPSEVEVPYFVQDTPAARGDLAKQYLSLSRLDQGIGLVLQELELAGHGEDTLVMYTSDNGIPFPGAKTNLYDSGATEPLLVSSPDHPDSWGTTNPVLTSLLDLTPTVLDWLNASYPKYHIFDQEPVKLTGKSLLEYLNRPITRESRSENSIYSGFERRLQELERAAATYGSHESHEITMYYPMRSIRTSEYKLILNLNYLMPYPVASDIYSSPTFQDILNRTESGDSLPWYKTLREYYYRGKWELYDLLKDPEELHNVAESAEYQPVRTLLRERLKDWQKGTSDPWQCSPERVWNTQTGKCDPLYNGI